MSFKDKVVYQIYPKSFCDANNDGIGDIQGVIAHLDYLKELGIDYIWFNPMTLSPGNDGGYDVANYRQLDPIYGSMEDFEELSNECAKRHINIMFDMVFNHTSTHHEWFQKALTGDPYYMRYYIFKKGKEPGVPPNNWQSKFGGPAWEYVEHLDLWYLHLFDVTQADLDWRNPHVQDEMRDIVNFWRSKGVHGFRFDVINLISKRSFEDDPNLFDGRQFYTDGPHVHDYLKKLNKESFGLDQDGLTVGELSAATINNCIEYSGEDSHELNSVFTFHHLKVDYKDKKKWHVQPFDFMELKNLFTTWQTELQAHKAWPALFWNCHDQPRSLSRFGDDHNYPLESGKMLATAIHMMRGIPYIYMGEEIGMTNAYFTSIDQYRDVESLNAYKILEKEGFTHDEIIKALQAHSRDNARTPMQWDDHKYAGFSDHEPWISVNSNYKQVNVKNNLQDPNSLFYHYQKLIALRKQYKVIQDGLYMPLLEDHSEIFAYKRETKDEELIVINNFYGHDTSYTLDFHHQYEVLISNYKDTKILSTGHLRPYESYVLYRKKENNDTNI